MDEFARLVGMEGVARVDQLKQNARNVADSANPAFSRDIVSSPGLCPDGHA